MQTMVRTLRWTQFGSWRVYPLLILGENRIAESPTLAAESAHIVGCARVKHDIWCCFPAPLFGLKAVEKGSDDGFDPMLTQALWKK
jgi:hypothetical protein